MSKGLFCFVCEMELPSTNRSDPDCQQAYDGVMFVGGGNYGSRIFDPQDGSQLRINICDDCLVDRAALVRHERWSVRRPQLEWRRLWEADPEILDLFQKRKERESGEPAGEADAKGAD